MQHSEQRRTFLKRASAGLGGILTASALATLRAHQLWAAECNPDSRSARRAGTGRLGYGPLARVPDQAGREVLALPAGFRYVTFGSTGQSMSDGFPTPRNSDGMTCLPWRDGVVRLIRNHELRNEAGDFRLGVMGPESTRYDRLAMGGCVTTDFDLRRKIVLRDFISLNGTMVNCCGGLAYRDSGWLSCEETISGTAQRFEKPHGYAFFVPKDAEEPVAARPIRAMGRFSHEAAVAENCTGIVYQTEDAANSSGFYRYLPNDPANLLAGGALQMLAVQGVPQYNAITGQRIGAELPVRWVAIDDPDPGSLSEASSCFAQGHAKGGARFNRLEGIFRGEDGIYFVSTSGGNAKRGQLWKYVPHTNHNGTLILVYESPGSEVLDSPDNLCISPRGGVLLCEDDASDDRDRHPLAPGLQDVNRLIGLGDDGAPFEFAANVLNETEFAGACFDPDGETLFVNIFGDGRPGSGMTCAIWGPWQRGPL